MTIDTTGTRSGIIDSTRWPGVAKVPGGPVAALSAKVATSLLHRAADRLPLRLAYPDGSVIGAADPTLPTLVLHDADRLARRIGHTGLIGFGESYMAGEWTSDDLAGVLTAFATSVADLVPRTLQRMRPIALSRQPSSQHNSRDQARRNISEHYDLSNELFAEFLDETMTYSSALFDQLPATQDRLAEAQRRKVDRLLDCANVGPGSRVLEIGTGWGELCLRAAERGAHIRSVTLSAEQQRLAQQRVAAAGLSDRVDIDLCDYRDVEGRYDAVISIEMIEAVGYAFWPTYFKTLDSLVTPGGRVAIQAITMPHSRMLASRNTHTWIQKYIFPGGLLPSTEAILGLTERHTSLRTVDMFAMGGHYAETLRLWREQFVERRNTVSALGFDDVFHRMWELYLAYSEAGFRSGYLDVYQWTFAPTGRPLVNLLVVCAASLAAIVLLFAVTFVIGRRIGRYNVVDVAWGLGFVVVAAVAAAVGTGDLLRRLLLLVLVAVWGLRLAWHMYGKSAGKGEDPRYANLLHDDFSAGTVLKKIFATQAVATWFVSLPLQVSAAAGPTPVGLLPVLALGVAIWLLGVVFEALGDHQLKVFKADPAHKGVVMDRGLWSWTRHPNYFGDACVWWGIWLVTLDGWPALATVLSPALMTYFLVWATGARPTEKIMADRPGFREYCSRTSFFVPRPPKKPAPSHADSG